ncbi:hypothetical protein GCM10012289_59860 [Nonomuraea cavernae]|uniref:Uncharacterized protein n=1 Tax=Nonomuraea cavernae TaxID=2045107 RepID=A0A918DQM8_9ACTN|nr:hypothetical protein GCM10012289_59860 [Nonomuraea cavernae]
MAGACAGRPSPDGRPVLSCTTPVSPQRVACLLAETVPPSGGRSVVPAGRDRKQGPQAFTGVSDGFAGPGQRQGPDAAERGLGALWGFAGGPGGAVKGGGRAGDWVIPR